MTRALPLKLIVTRPAPSAQRFAQAVHEKMGRPVETILSPAFEIRPIEVKDTIASPAGLIFTSVNGVQQTQRLGLPADVMAWCVGDKTAQAARAAGFAVRVGAGDAHGLIERILADRPAGQLVHVSGVHTLGDIADHLNAAGLNARQIIAYEQQPLTPTQQLVAALAGNEPLVIPMFSQRSTLLLSGSEIRAPLFGVAISANVAAMLVDLEFDTVATAAQPTEDAMISETCKVLDRLLDRPTMT